MSDPVSNSEIEDVLASIRRLVSENAKALKGDRARDPEAEKLVLTPALRIDESEAEAAPSDVFAVDTDAWNEVSGKPEETENAGVFSHRAQTRPTLVESADEAAGAAKDAAEASAKAVTPDSAAEAVDADADASDDAAHGEAAEAAGETVPGAETSGGAESAKAEKSAPNALEQSIAELETAMDLRPAVEESARDAEPQRADDATEGAAEPAATAASDAPPKSWIEGLVAAAAAAEATRLAERAKASPAAETAAEPETVADPEEADAVEETVADADAEVAKDAMEAEDTAEAAELGTFELTAAHAAPVEPEPDEAVAVFEQDVEVDAAPTGEGETAPGDEVAAEAMVDEDVVTARADDTAEVAEIEADAVEPYVAEQEAAAIEEVASEVEPGPERSWVDRLIAAAATLRSAPDADEKQQAAGDHVGEAAEDAGVEATPATEAEVAPEAVADEDATEDAAKGASEAADVSAAPLTLEPLNLVDPITSDADVVAEAEAEAVVLEWEAVEPPVEVDTDDGEGDVDLDTVLTGPWSAAAVESDAVTDAEDAPDAEPETAAETVSAEASDAAEDVPVGSLEWEPVELAEEADAEISAADQTDAEDGADRIDAAEIAAEAAGADEARSDTADLAQEADFQQETKAESDGSEGVAEVSPVADWDEAAEDEDPQGDEIDADAAAVAAAAEADVDWEEAGLAAAGVAVAAAVADTGEADREAGEPEARKAPGSALDDEMLIDESMLRELVAQLVRDELQGAVGERITHNVRRLIRREIARALTLQDFER